jgi:large subunit ribosomal protein L35
VPKMKTHSGAKKRFKLTAKGKVKRKSANKNHINAKLSPQRRRRLGKATYVNKADEARIKRMLGVGG